METFSGSFSKRLLAVLTALLLAFSLPMPALAEEGQKTSEESTAETAEGPIGKDPEATEEENAGPGESEVPSVDGSSAASSRSTMQAAKPDIRPPTIGDIVIPNDSNHTLHFDDDASPKQWWLDATNYTSATVKGEYDENSAITFTHGTNANTLTIGESVTLKSIEMLGSNYYLGMNLRITDGAHVAFTDFVAVRNLTIDKGSELIVKGVTKNPHIPILVYLSEALILDSGTIDVSSNLTGLMSAINVTNGAAGGGGVSHLNAISMSNNSRIDVKTPEGYNQNILVENGNASITSESSIRSSSGTTALRLPGNLTLNGRSSIDFSGSGVGVIVGSNFTMEDATFTASNSESGVVISGNLIMDEATFTVNASESGYGMLVGGDIEMGSTGTITVDAGTGIEVDGSVSVGGAGSPSAASFDLTTNGDALRVKNELSVYGSGAENTSIEAMSNLPSTSRGAAIKVGGLALDSTKVVALSAYATSGDRVGLSIEDPTAATHSAEVTNSTIEASGAINGMKLDGGEFNFIGSTITSTVLTTTSPVSPMVIPTDPATTTAAIYSLGGIFTLDDSSLSAMGGDYGWRSTYSDNLAVPPLENNPSGVPSKENRLRITNGSDASFEADVCAVFVNTEITVSGASKLKATSRLAQPQDDGTAYEHMPAVFLTNYDETAGRVISVTDNSLLHETYPTPVSDAISSSSSAPSKPYHSVWNISDYAHYDWTVPSEQRIVVASESGGLYTTSDTSQPETSLGLVAQRSTSNAGEKIRLADGVHMISLTANFQAHALPTYTVTFDTHGGEPQPTQQIIAKGATVNMPTNVIREGYALEGWYTEAGYLNKWDFKTSVTQDMTLHAKWTEAGDGHPLAKTGDPMHFLLGFLVLASMVSLATLLYGRHAHRKQ